MPTVELPEVPLAERLSVSPREAALLLGLSHATVYGMLNRGELRSVKLGARRLIAVSDLRRLVEGEDVPSEEAVR